MKETRQVLLRMKEYTDRWQRENDHRYIFLSCYSLMTGNMIKAIENNEFHDSKWVTKLLELFSEYYFDGLECYECGNNKALVWHEVYETTKKDKLLELQYLMIGVNAHINYDLVFTLYDMLSPEWSRLTEEERSKRYEDHCHVNKVIAATIDRVQDEILEPSAPYLDWIDKAFGRLDEYILSKVISNWREDVWINCHKLLAVNSQEERETLRLEIEKDVVRLGKMISFYN